MPLKKEDLLAACMQLSEADRQLIAQQLQESLAKNPAEPVIYDSVFLEELKMRTQDEDDEEEDA